MTHYAKQIMGSVDGGFHEFMGSLTKTQQEQIERLSTQCWAETGKVLIEQDSDSDAVFVIEQGVAEVAVELADSKISPPLVYLGRGDIIGELGVMNHCLRTATVRAASDVYYRRFDAEVFLDMMVNMPGFAAFIAGRLARRVTHTTINIAYNSMSTDLSGKLPQFDMISVFYTVAGSGSTGELKVIDCDRNTLGKFFFEEGTLVDARYRHLRGLEACHQLFIEHTLEGAFTYKRSESPTEPVSEASYLSIQVEDIVFEGALLRDRFDAMPESLKALKGKLKVTTFDPDAGQEDTLDARQRIADIVSHGQVSLRDVWSRSALSQVTFAKACLEMQELGQILHDD